MYNYVDSSKELLPSECSEKFKFELAYGRCGEGNKFYKIRKKEKIKSILYWVWC